MEQKRQKRPNNKCKKEKKEVSLVQTPESTKQH